MERPAFTHLLIIFLLASCTAANQAPTPSPLRAVPTLFPTVARAPSLPTDSPATQLAPDTGWAAGRPGLELRQLRLSLAADRPAVPLIIVRLDPSKIRLRVAYAPEQPRGLRSWFDQAHALAAINGSFFTQEYRATALVVSDGVPSGASYEGFGGMLAVGPNGAIALRPLRDEPYDPNEAFDQAMQSFPMLVFPGGAPAAIEDNGERARRTVVAIDQAGRLLLIIGPTSGFTLRGLAEWLSQSDLQIDRALNLDGGSSTGLYLRDGALQASIDSFGLLPIVLLVEPR